MERPLVDRLETIARRIEGTIKGQVCAFGTKHPSEIREAASRIAELEAALRDALETLESYADRDMPPTVVGLFIGRFRSVLSDD